VVNALEPLIAPLKVNVPAPLLIVLAVANEMRSLDEAVPLPRSAPPWPAAPAPFSVMV